MAKTPLELYDQLVNEGMKPGTPVNAPSHTIWVKNPKNEWKMWGGHDSDDINTIDVDAFKKKGYSDLRLVPNGENWDYNDRIFDDYGLITDKGRSQLKDFLSSKNLTTQQVMKLPNEQFNNLAKEVQQKYGIDDFDLAQEFLVSELDWGK